VGGGGGKVRAAAIYACSESESGFCFNNLPVLYGSDGSDVPENGACGEGNGDGITVNDVWSSDSGIENVVNYNPSLDPMQVYALQDDRNDAYVCQVMSFSGDCILTKTYDSEAATDELLASAGLTASNACVWQDAYNGCAERMFGDYNDQFWHDKWTKANNTDHALMWEKFNEVAVNITDNFCPNSKIPSQCGVTTANQMDCQVIDYVCQAKQWQLYGRCNNYGRCSMCECKPDCPPLSDELKAEGWIDVTRDINGDRIENAYRTVTDASPNGFQTLLNQILNLYYQVDFSSYITDN
jgi:hypothetical protein